jgi:hypothetical protein
VFTKKKNPCQHGQGKKNTSKPNMDRKKKKHPSETRMGKKHIQVNETWKEVNVKET